MTRKLPRPKSSKSPDWLFGLLLVLLTLLFGGLYLQFTLWVFGDSWGRGPKPFWFDLAVMFSQPGMVGFPISPFLLGGCLGFPVASLLTGVKTLGASSRSNRQSSRPKASKWPYGLFIPLFGIFYFGFTLLVIAQAWGSRGVPKPSGFDLAALFAMPGMIGFPISPFVVGGGVGFVVAWIVSNIIKWRSR
ncbi:hypothetical protein IQ266_13705 [filamentous cyanobacterium LEGE 11480]|uniref:Uncharacterized protein n=1 Tax=Romeriopsis navalis LEGE 11480 TaxID=2777977 RepID=A0A928VQP9_9CYAN|nr:hypothetical protein [Romeriopsis navalis]MBE9030787.1 hypothetical protein [Romeriopsis navalis LEGE 11480]